MPGPDRTGSALTAVPARHLLARVLDDPRLVASVQALAPRALARLIRRVGLEDAGELIALATTEQLGGVFDEDLWRSPRPGVDEAFDARRFALWLEVMVVAGEELAARRVSELDEDLVSLALHQLVLVIDMDHLAAQVADRGDEEEVDELEKALEASPCEELGRYRVIARRSDGWDAIVAVLVALDRDHHDLLERLLDRLAHLSAEVIDDGGGLVEILTAEETLAVDAAAAREDRRAAQGHVAPSAAASFLALARSGAEVPEGTEDPITRAYFREWAPTAAGARGPVGASAVPAAPSPADAASAARLLELVHEEDAALELRPLLGGGAADQDALRAALAELADRDPDAHEQRVRELHYLANVLIAGGSLAGRRYRPVEAAEAVLAACRLGLEVRGQARSPLASTSAVALFRAGWHRLHAGAAEPAPGARSWPPDGRPDRRGR